jgi:5-methylcytosine-specific restriction endonuclease McrA
MPSNYANNSSKKPRAKTPPVSSSSDIKPKPQTPGERMAAYKGEQRHPSGRAWKRIVANVIDAYAGICHLCGHPGALQADHLVQYAEGGDDSIGNLRPVHGVANTQNNRCPVCELACNNIRGALSVEAGKAKIAKRQRNVVSEGQGDREW